MSARLLQLAGVIVDLLYTVDAVPLPGEEAIVTDFSISPGGGFNAMVAAKRAGTEISYGGSLGTGPFAQIVRKGLEAEDIPILGAQDTERDQGCCTVMIDRGGDRTFVASEGAEGFVEPEELKQLPIADFDWMLLSGYALYYDGSRQAICEWLQQGPQNSRLVFDPCPVVGAVPPHALEAARARATWISANAREATVMTGITDPVKSAMALAREMPAEGGAVVRDGKKGCIIATSEFCEVVPGFPVMAIDTNGAGDTHLGSFIARLAQGDHPQTAAHYANVAAALSTRERGPATAPDRVEVISKMNSKEAV